MPQAEPTQGEELPAITNMDEFWMASQSPSTNGLERTVDMVFAVLHYDPEWGTLWVQSNGAGNYMPISGAAFAFVAGDRVRLTGSIIPKANFERHRLSAEVLESDALPEPVPIAGDVESYAEYNMRIVSLEGYIDQLTFEDPGHLAYDLIRRGRRMDYRVQIHTTQPLPQIIGQFVRVQGLLDVKAAQGDEPEVLTVWTHDSAAVTKVETRESQLFERDATPIAKLSEIVPGEGAKIAGFVYSQEPGRRLILRDTSGQIEVATPQNSLLPRGAAVELVGIPSFNGVDWTLANAIYRKPASSGTAQDASLAEQILLSYRLAEQILAMPAEQLEAGHTAKLSGVVTFCDPDGAFFYLQDSSGGIRVSPEEPLDRVLPPGEGVEVEGRIANGRFSPMLLADRVVSRGSLILPQSLRLSYEQAIAGHEDNQWVELSGYVERKTQNGARTRLLISTIDGEFDAWVSSPEGPTDLEEGSNVRLRGVLAVRADEQRKLQGISLLIPSPNFASTETSPLENPFELPLTRISDLQRYKPSSIANEHVRVSGIVTHHEPGKFLVLADGEESLRVLSRSSEEARPGDRLEVVGATQRTGSRVQLRNPIFRKVGQGEQPPAAIPLDPESQGIDNSLNGRLVSARGLLLEAVSYQGKTRLLLQSGSMILEGIGSHPSLGQTNSLLQKGAEVALTGVYDISYDQHGEPDKLSILIRDSDDILVLEPAPWWSPARAMIVTGLCFGALFIAGSWSALLRRRVNSQTQLIRQQVAREALLETQHREIVSSVSDFIYTIDFDGRFLSFNEAGERLTGYSREEAAALTIYDLLDERQSRHVWLVLKRRRTQRNAVFDTQIRRKDGSLVWVEFSGGFLRREGQAICAFGVIRDIDARKQAEEELKRARDAAEENTRAKSAFLATMSHELRTPMNGVIGMTDLLLDLEICPQAREFAETIRDSATSLLVLLNDILDMSKAEAGKLTIEPHPFNLSETVQQPLALMEANAAAKGLNLQLDPLPETPNQLVGDAGRLRQVLLNLLGNAIKFTDRGHVRLSLSLVEESDQDLLLRFEIADTGIGIPEKALAKLFQPFVQADASHSRRFGGTGLGLNISREIVALLGGEIGLRSEEGRGSTFWFTARFSKSAGEEAAPAAGGAGAKPARTWHGPPLAILIAEDTPVNQRVTRLQLKKMGFEADLANNGIEVLNAVERKSYDVIFMDCQMPGMDGFEATERLRRDPRHDGIYIVALTANAMAGDRERCLASGMNDYVSKPTRPDKLLAALPTACRASADRNQ